MLFNPDEIKSAVACGFDAIVRCTAEAATTAGCDKGAPSTLVDSRVRRCGRDSKYLGARNTLVVWKSEPKLLLTRLKARRRPIYLHESVLRTL
jgi:hypothetical protein